MPKKYNIGDVVFAKDGKYIQDLLGNPRVELLTKFYNHEPLPQGVTVWAMNGHGYLMQEDLQHEDVNWDTSGIPVKEGTQ